jgi:hypothetical protein
VKSLPVIDHHGLPVCPVQILFSEKLVEFHEHVDSRLRRVNKTAATMGLLPECGAVVQRLAMRMQAVALVSVLASHLAARNALDATQASTTWLILREQYSRLSHNEELDYSLLESVNRNLHRFMQEAQ